MLDVVCACSPRTAAKTKVLDLIAACQTHFIDQCAMTSTQTGGMECLALLSVSPNVWHDLARCGSRLAGVMAVSVVCCVPRVREAERGMVCA